MLQRNSKNKAVQSIIAVLLLTLLLISLAAAFFFWFTQIQTHGQNIGLANEEEFIQQGTTTIEVIDEVVYNSLAEKNPLEDAFITVILKNTGSRKINFSETESIQLILYTENDVLCISNITGNCLDSASRTIVGGENSSIYYSETSSFDSSTKINDEIITALTNYNDYVLAGTATNSRIFLSKDGINWKAKHSFGKGEVSEFLTNSSSIYGIVNFENGDSSLVLSEDSGFSWEKIFNFSEVHFYDLELFNNQIFLVGENDTNGTIVNVSGTSKTEWFFDKKIASIGKVNEKLYAGTGGGKNNGYFLVFDSGNWDNSYGPYDSEITEITEYKNNIYFSTKKENGTGKVRMNTTGPYSFSEINGISTEINEISKIKVINNTLYAISSNNSGNSHIYYLSGFSFYKKDEIPFSVLNDITHLSGCDQSLVECSQGCSEGVLEPDAVREFKFRTENTICDISSNESRDFSIKLNIGKDAQIINDFEKYSVDEKLKNTPCELSWPLCNGKVSNPLATCEVVNDHCEEVLHYPCNATAFSEASCSDANDACPDGYYCNDTGSTCECAPLKTTCSSLSPPDCYKGTCSGYKNCTELNGACVCLDCWESYEATPRCSGGCLLGNNCNEGSFSCYCGSYTPPPDEICNNDLDDDLDGNTDCADSECTYDPACYEYICYDSIDNEYHSDGLIDCNDPDCNLQICNQTCDIDNPELIPDTINISKCTPENNCAYYETQDCPPEDPNCIIGNPIDKCSGEICHNNADDDSDSFIDCADTEDCEDLLCWSDCNETAGKHDYYFCSGGTCGAGHIQFDDPSC